MSEVSKVVSDRDRARLQLKEYVMELAAARGQEDDVMDKLIFKVNEAFDVLLNSHVEMVLSLGESLSDETHENFMYEASDERDEAVVEAELEKVKMKGIIKEKTIVRESIKVNNLGLMVKKDREESFDEELEISRKVSQEVTEGELLCMFSAWVNLQDARPDASLQDGEVPHEASRALIRAKSSKKELPSIPEEIFNGDPEKFATEVWNGGRVQISAESSTEIWNGASRRDSCEGPHDVTSGATNQEPRFEGERMAAAPAHLGRALGHAGCGVQRQSCHNQLDSVRASVETKVKARKLKVQSKVRVPKTTHAISYPLSASPQTKPPLLRPKRIRKGHRRWARRKRRRRRPTRCVLPSTTKKTAMFDLSKLDIDNQVRIRALREEDMAEKSRQFGRAKVGAWGPDHVFVPVAEAERRESLIPFTGCKCEEGLGFRPGHIGHQHVGAHMARVVVDRLRHEEPGDDLGVGRAGEGAQHVVECQQLERWHELVAKRRAQQEADRKKAREKEAKKEMDDQVEKLLKVKIGIPRQEGRASLMREGKRAAAEIEKTGMKVTAPQGETSCDRARRLIHTLQNLKRSEVAVVGPNKDEDESREKVVVATQAMIKGIQNESITKMQRKLAQLVIKKEVKLTEEGEAHLM